MAQIDDYLAHMIASRGSDLHLSTDEPARMRVDGDMVVIDETPLTAEMIQTVVFELLEESQREKLIKEKNLDFAYQVSQELGNFRFNIFYTRRGIAMVARAIPSKIPTVEQLGLPPIIAKLTEAHKGLILVTGPTGSGKSTTLAAMINHINNNESGHILTVEDPVEFIHPSKKSLINQRQIGQSVHTFADALKYALREDPDVILVGEMRDIETIGLALTAAETGHLVFGTLHTRGAASSIDRIIDSFPGDQQAMVRVMLSESLIAVVSQALLKKADGKGRVAAYEIMVVNSAISNLIREGKTFQITSALQTGRGQGMILMEQHIRELMKNGTVSEQEGQKYLAELLGGHGTPAAGGGGGGHGPAAAAKEVAKAKAPAAAAAAPVPAPAPIKTLPKIPVRPEPKPEPQPERELPQEPFNPNPMSERTAIAQVPGLATMGRSRKPTPLNPPTAAVPNTVPVAPKAATSAPRPPAAAPAAPKGAPPPLGRPPSPSPAPAPAVPPPANMTPPPAAAPAAPANPGFTPTFNRPANPPLKAPEPAPPQDFEPSLEANIETGLQVLPTSADARDIQSSLVDLTDGEEEPSAPAAPTFRPKKAG